MRHAEIVELILQFEELTAAERNLAAAHLEECQACRSLLANLQEAEGAALSPGDLPHLPPDPDGDPAGGLQGDDLRQAQASRMLLLQRVRQSGRSWRLTPLGWSGLSLALAACLVLAFWLPGPGTDADVIRNCYLTTPTLLRSGDSGELQVGDPFAVGFTLTEAGWPVVVTMTPAGELAVLYPWDTQAVSLSADRAHVLPPTGAPVTWRLKDEATTVWLALDNSGALDPVLLRQDLAASHSPDQVTAYLRQRFGSAAVSIVTPTAR